MIDAAQLQPLRDRRASLSKRLADLDARAAKIAREREELQVEAQAIDTTLQTLAKVYGVENTEDEEPANTRSSSKPANAPTMYSMVESILEEAQLWGHDFLEGNEIYESIRKRWWPGAPRNSVMPSLHRFEKEGRLIKLGTRYGLPAKNEALGGQTPSASEAEWNIDDEPF